MASMRAAQFHRYGPPDVLGVASVPVPIPKAGEVLVRVGAATVNGGELLGRAGKLRAITGKRFPKGIGVDFAGTVTALGAGITGIAVGDRVWGVLPALQIVLSQATVGSMAEYVVVAADRIGATPSALSDVEAASLLAGGTVAIVGLRDKAHLVSGERILIRGATGGIGSIAVQLAHAFGAHVTALVGPGNLAFVEALGADEALDYTTTTVAQLGRYDVIFDTVGSQMGAYRRHLAPGGRMVTIALDPPLRALGIVIASTIFGPRRIRPLEGNPKRALLMDLARYVEGGTLHAVIDSVYSLDEIVAAHRSAERRGGRGKRVITMHESCEGPATSQPAAGVEAEGGAGEIGRA